MVVKIAKIVWGTNWIPFINVAVDKDIDSEL